MKSNALVERFSAANEAQEADFIASEIERAVGGTSLYSLDSGRASPDASGLAFHDVAVLFRLSAQGEAIEEALIQGGLPFHRVRDDALVARPFVGKVVQILRRLVEKGEGKVDLARDVGNRPVAELIERLDPTSRLDPRHRRAVDLLAALAIPFGTDAAGFLSSVAAMRDTDIALEPQKIALLTLHASKGLEFPLVFIAGCEDGVLPLRLPGIPPASVEEERRLLYVGMTRAKHRLVLTCARTRNILGRTVENGACPFLSGLPPELISDLRMPSRAKRVRQLPLL